MLPIERKQMQADLADVKKKINSNRTNFSKRLLGRLKKSPYGIVDPVLLNRLRIRNAGGPQRKAESMETAKEILRQLEHFDRTYQTAFQGDPLTRWQLDAFKHQKEANQALLLRRKELAHQLNEAFWNREVASKSTLGINILKKEADYMENSKIISTGQGSALRAALSSFKEKTAIDPPTYRNLLVSALGASDEEARHMRTWSFRTVKEILG